VTSELFQGLIGALTLFTFGFTSGVMFAFWVAGREL
jgi:hypothetical protein